MISFSLATGYTPLNPSNSMNCNSLLVYVLKSLQKRIKSFGVIHRFTVGELKRKLRSWAMHPPRQLLERIVTSGLLKRFLR